MIQAKARSQWPDGQVVHLRYTDLARDPMAALHRLYDHFCMPGTPAFEWRAQDLIPRKSHGGYGQNVYRLEDHGLNAEAERSCFRAYMDAFDVEPRSAAPAA